MSPSRAGPSPLQCYLRCSWMCPGCRFDATQMRKKAAETTRWKDVPHLDEAFIHQNLKHMVALQIIGPPGQSMPGTKAPEQQ